MTPNEVRTMSDSAIVELIVSLPQDEGARALSSDTAYAAFMEIRRRYSPTIDLPKTAGGRFRCANSVELDPERWRSAWYRRRLALTRVAEIAGKSYTWAHSVIKRGSVSYYALDVIAAELGETTDDLVWEIGSDRERLRSVRV